MLDAVNKIFKNQTISVIETHSMTAPISVESFINFASELSEPSFEAQYHRKMSPTEKQNARDAKIAARTLYEVQSVFKQIIKQSSRYIRTEAYIIMRMAQIVNDQRGSEYDPFRIKKLNQIKF